MVCNNKIYHVPKQKTPDRLQFVISPDVCLHFGTDILIEVKEINIKTYTQ